MRSIVRRDTGESYDEFLTGLAKASGIETPTREDMVRLDRKRQEAHVEQGLEESGGRGCGGLAKMKDGRTHLAHKARARGRSGHRRGAGSDVASGRSGRHDHARRDACAKQAWRWRSWSGARPSAAGREAQGQRRRIEELVADKGYHRRRGGPADEELRRPQLHSGEATEGRRNWEGKAEQQQAVYQNRRRVRSEYGKSLLKRRGELVERSFAHCYETGGLRHCHLRGERTS